MGQIERFPAMRLNARYMIRDETPAGTLGKERDAPKGDEVLRWRRNDALVQGTELLMEASGRLSPACGVSKKG